MINQVVKGQCITLTHLETINHNNNNDLTQRIAIAYKWRNVLLQFYQNIISKKHQNNDINDIYCKFLHDSLKILTKFMPLSFIRNLHAKLEDLSSFNNITFLDAFGGTGKTWVSNNLLSCFSGLGIVCLPTASSGIAGVLLKGGRTFHLQFKVPPNIEENSICTIEKGTKLANHLINAGLIIFDEAVMQPKECLMALNRTLNDFVSNDNCQFANIPMLLCGDFRQILPVVPRGSRHNVIDATISKLPFWNKVNIFHLTINERVLRNGNTEKLRNFSNWLLKLGEGRILNHENINPFSITMPQHLMTKSETDIEFIHEIYDNITSHFDIKNIDANKKYFLNRAVLTTKNKTVDKLNDMILNNMTNKDTLPKTYYATDSVEPEDAWQADLQQVKKETPSGFPLYNLKIKVGSPIMCLRNLDVENKLCNGTRLIVTFMGKNIIKAVRLNDPTNTELLIPRIIFTPGNNNTVPYGWQRKQFPVRLCFVMTINKSQGQTIGRVGVLLKEPVFAHGMLYVACSRATNPDTLKIKIDTIPWRQGDILNNNTIITDNVVWKEIFSNV